MSWKKSLLIAAVLAAFFYFLYASRQVLTPFLFAFVFAYTLDPLVRVLERCHIPRTLAIILLMLLASFLLLLLVLLVGPLVRQQLENLASNLPTSLEQTRRKLEPLLQRLPDLQNFDAQEVLSEVMTRFGALPEHILRTIPTIISTSFSGVVSVIYVALNLLVIPVATFYFLRDFEALKEQALTYLPQRYHQPVVTYLREIDRVLSNFMRGQLIVALILASCYSLGLVLVGTPMGLLLGLFAGVVSFIPYLGLILGLGPALLLTFLQFQDWQHPMLVVGVFAAAQFLEGSFVTPRVVGGKLGLHPVAVMMAVLLGGNFFGVLGVLLAVPAAAVLRVLLDGWLLARRRTASPTPGTLGPAK